MARRHSGAVGEMIIAYLLCVDIDTPVDSVLIFPTVTEAWSCH